MTPTNTPEAARLAEELRRYADLIEDEMVDEPKRCVGDAGDCAAPVMRQAADALSALAKQDAAPTSIPPSRLAINPTHEAAAAFWTYWRENGETHRHGYYESTWGAINSALRSSGIREHDYGAAPTSASTVPAGFWLAPMEPDQDLCEAIADVKRRRLLRAIEAARIDDEINPRGLVPACGEEFRAARDHYLARNPGACSVTDGEAKK